MTRAEWNLGVWPWVVPDNTVHFLNSIRDLAFEDALTLIITREQTMILVGMFLRIVTMAKCLCYILKKGMAFK